MACEGKYPIRDVAELTGVNPVTLRAWQRRYGLIKPARTDSGHRLYSDDDIDRIRRILHWLDQGVSIGKVRALLDAPSNAPSKPQWQAIIDNLVDASNQLRSGKLDSELRELSRQYPNDHFLLNIVRPWLAQLAQSARVDQTLIEQVSRQTLAELLSRFIKSRPGPLVAVARCGRAHPLESVLARYELQGLKFRSIDLGEVEPDQLALAVQRIQAVAYVVIPGAGLNASWFEKHSEHWPPNTVFSGEIGRIYASSGWLPGPYHESIRQLVTDNDAFTGLV
jgi:DNA-binding transcriptional MerR regulator